MIIRHLCRHCVGAYMISPHGTTRLNTASHGYVNDIRVLLNSDATKAQVTHALKEALESASEEDIVFFYFSGHGTREEADPLFREIEPDHALESLVCFDSVLAEGTAIQYNLLCDKELHYLLSAFGKPGTHLVLMFDCCHAGGVTRNQSVSGLNSEILERRYLPQERMLRMAPMRNWDDFMFAETLPRYEVETHGWLRAVPQQRHLTLSACQNDESAFEVNGQGVFTRNVLDILRRTQGALTYYDLHSRVRLFTQHQFRQTPEIYATQGHENDLFRTFLDRPALHRPLGGTCYANKNGKWAIDLGAIHGITPYCGPVEIDIDGELTQAQITEVSAHESTIVLTEERASLHPGHTYTAYLRASGSAGTAFYFDNKTASLREAADSWLNAHRAPFIVTQQMLQAAYVVNAEADVYRICKHEDALRPVTEVPKSDPAPSERILQYMRHIAQWEYIRTLCNPDFVASACPVNIEVTRIHPDGSKEAIAFKGDTVEFDYDRTSTGTYSGKVKVRITNSGGVKYYCALLYLSNQFQVFSLPVDGKVSGLNPGEVGWVYHGRELVLDLEKHVTEFQFPHSIFYLKLLACPDPFSIEHLEQSPLPAPTRRMHRGKESVKRNEITTRGEQAAGGVEWFARTLCIKVRNPHFISS